MDKFLQLKEDGQTDKDKLTAAEVTSVYHTVQNGQSYRPADCRTKLAPTIFLNSDIAKKMSCVWTKAAAIKIDMLAPCSGEELSEKSENTSCSPT